MLMSLAFLLEVKVKKSKKLTKIIKIEEVIIHIFWESWWISIKFSGNVTYDDIKMIKIQSFTLSSDCIYFIYILVWGVTSILDFAKLAIFILFI